MGRHRCARESYLLAVEVCRTASFSLCSHEVLVEWCQLAVVRWLVKLRRPALQEGRTAAALDPNRVVGLIDTLEGSDVPYYRWAAFWPQLFGACQRWTPRRESEPESKHGAMSNEDLLR